MSKKRSRKYFIKLLDDLARKYIRERDKVCSKCRRQGHHVHHIRKRKYYTTRWEPDNLIFLCKDCHNETENNPTAFSDWFIKTYPERNIIIQSLARISVDTWRDSDLEEIEEMLREKLAGTESDEIHRDNKLE